MDHVLFFKYLKFIRGVNTGMLTSGRIKGLGIAVRKECKNLCKADSITQITSHYLIQY